MFTLLTDVLRIHKSASEHSTSLLCNSIKLNVQEILGAALIFDYDNAKAAVLHAIYLFLPRDINLPHNATVPEQNHLRY